MEKQIDMEKLTEQPIKKKIRNFITLNSVTKDEIRQEYNEIFDKLKEYEDSNGWISVEDRLPEIRQKVLVCARDHIDTDWLTNDGKWMYCQIRKITHWMPLPQPPKMKGTDSEK